MVVAAEMKPEPGFSLSLEFVPRPPSWLCPSLQQTLQIADFHCGNMFTGSKIYKISPAALKERISYKTIGLKARHRRENFGILEARGCPLENLKKSLDPWKRGSENTGRNQSRTWR